VKTESRLLFSQRAALDRAGAPTAGPDGAPVSDGWRAAWAANELVRLRAERDRYAAVLPYVIRESDEGLGIWLRGNGSDSSLGWLPHGLDPAEVHARAMALVWGRLRAEDERDEAYLEQVTTERDEARAQLAAIAGRS